MDIHYLHVKDSARDENHMMDDTDSNQPYFTTIDPNAKVM